MFMTRFLSLLAVCAGLSHGLAMAPAQAQNLFAPVIQVNEDVITAFELQQRELFLRIVAPARSSAAVARADLIDDALRKQALKQAGLELTDAEVRDGMDEFAGRANLTTAEFLQALGQRGVAEETFRDFVAISTGWRDFVRARFGARVQVTETDIDRALAASGSGSSLRVLLSEIIMPAPPREAAAVLARAERISQTTSEAEFSAAARRYSATASRGRGGRLEWTPISNLPPILRPLLLALAPGEVTQPIPIPNAVALFQLRGIEETDRIAPEYSAIEYAQYFIPGGRSEAALAEANRVRAATDVCDDLYGFAKDQPEEVLTRDTLAPADIPQDIALELAKLDDNEVSTALVSADGQNLVFLMLCGRTATDSADVSRDGVANQLRTERLTGFANSFLEQLRADARIRNK
ncbi:MAG: peptidylprolyl isomerase [Aliishimia sp.]